MRAAKRRIFDNSPTFSPCYQGTQPSETGLARLRPPPCSPGNLRRREASTPLDAIAGVNGAYVPGVLTAAGVTGAFGAIYAAHALYAFIDPRAAFPALGIVALAAMAAAMLHGPALAGLGLVGALATPLLVSSARHRQHPFRIRGDRAARWGPAA